ncbi:SUKH-4 family immunity protein [Nonlabens sp. Asnod3-A02]|uniref:SUKH-4 family immunity protein n=1 Tax=Nonlabens sp. Asnod3-A02 TaxID=3160579 RepID=UPI0038697F44
MLKKDQLRKWNTIASEILYFDNKSNNYNSVNFDFLREIGMPSECWEFSFENLKEKNLKTVNYLWKLQDINYDNFLSIGSNGSGDPIAINIATEELIYFNHDNFFEEILINSNLSCFAQCVLKIDSFLNNLIKLEPNSIFENEFTDQSYELLLSELKEIDPRVFSLKTNHWNIMLDSLKWERDEERKDRK